MARRLMALSLTLALAMALAAPAFASPATNGSPSTTTRCKVSDLESNLNGGDGGLAGMGHEGTNVVLTNVSGQACTLYGYAGFGLQGKHHRAQQTNVVRGSTYFGADPGARTVRLLPGESAHAELVWSKVSGPGESTGKQCEPTSEYLEITPPNDYGHLTVPFGSYACEHGTMYTTAFTAGTGS